MNEDRNSKEARAIGLVIATIVLACFAAIIIALTWNLVSWILNV